MVQSKVKEASDRGVARKREIVIAASKAFREKGFHATGMRDIAARLGITVGSLYYYFRNKEELLGFCQDDTLVRLDALVEDVRGRGLGPDEALFALIAGHVVCLNEGAWGSLAHLEIPESDTPEIRALLDKRHRYRRLLQELIEDGIAEGVFARTDAGLAVMAILGAVNWTVRWFDANGDKSAREVGRTFAAQLVRGLLAPGRTLRHEQDDAMAGSAGRARKAAPGTRVPRMNGASS